MCVRGLVPKEGILSSASWTGFRVSRGTPLSTFVGRSHKELCPRKPARPEKRMKRVSHFGDETPK